MLSCNSHKHISPSTRFVVNTPKPTRGGTRCTYRGPYFDGTNFASWKHKMKMHILGHNPTVWAIMCISLQGEFFDGREPNREATAEELKILEYNTQACDILVMPRIHCARCLPVIRHLCHVICLRVALCHVIICISYHVIMCIAFAYVFVSCIRAFSPLSVLQSGAPMSSGVPFYLSFVCGD